MIGGAGNVRKRLGGEEMKWLLKRGTAQRAAVEPGAIPSDVGQLIFLSPRMISPLSRKILNHPKVNLRGVISRVPLSTPSIQRPVNQTCVRNHSTPTRFICMMLLFVCLLVPKNEI